MAATPTVQAGVITLANGASSVTVDRGVDPGFDTAVDLTKCIPGFTQRTAATSADQVADFGITMVLTDADTITFERTGTAGDVILEWTLTSFASGVVTQQKTLTMTGTASATAAIDAASISGGRWIIPLGVRASSALDRPSRSSVRLAFDSTTQISGTRGNGTGNAVASCVVVEHDSATVQEVSSTYTTTTNTTENQAVSAVTIANTAVWATQSSDSSSGIPSSNWTWALTSTTNLAYTRSAGTSGTYTIRAFVVSFSDGTTVATYNPAHGDGTGTVNTTVTAVTTARTIPVASGTWMPSMGICANVAFGRAMSTADLTTTTNLQTIKGITTTAVTFAVQVVEFAEGGASAATTGTLATGTRTQSAIVTGGLTIILTLSGDTFVASGATFDAIRDDILAGLDAATSPATGWNTLVRDAIAVTTVVRTSDTVCTITLPAIPTYAITADEVITCTIPAAALTGAVAIESSPTITIHEGAVLSAYSGTTNASGVLTTDLTSDIAGTRVLTTALVNGTVVARTTTLPS